jgi:GT2 family glycosyltransferase
MGDAALMTDVSIIIVNWNSKQFLTDCIGSIYRYTQDIDYEVIVVDSGSFDGCGELIDTDFPAVRFIQSEANLGFAGANNLAFRHSRGRNILFLNPDTELTSAAVNLLADFVERRPNAGAVGCRLLNRDGSVQTSCIQAYPTLLNQLLNTEYLRRLSPTSGLWGMAPLFSSERDPAEVEVVSGACLMMRRSTFEQIGGFGEEYFMYAEDLDLCYKAAQAGFRNYYLPQATVRHFGGGATESAPSEFAVVMMRESVWRFLRKTRGAVYGVSYRLATMVSAAIRLGILILLMPLQHVLHLGARQPHTIRKWIAILAWSLRIKRASSPL